MKKLSLGTTLVWKPSAPHPPPRLSPHVPPHLVHTPRCKVFFFIYRKHKTRSLPYRRGVAGNLQGSCVYPHVVTEEETKNIVTHCIPLPHREPLIPLQGIM